MPHQNTFLQDTEPPAYDDWPYQPSQPKLWNSDVPYPEVDRGESAQYTEPDQQQTQEQQTTQVDPQIPGEELVADEQIENIEVRWSGEINTVQEARNFLASLSETLQIPKVQNDDAEGIRRGGLATFGSAILQAIVHRPATTPTGLQEEQRLYYIKQQRGAMSKIQHALSTDQGQKKAESMILMLLDAAIDCHIVGLPREDFTPKAASKGSYKSLTNLTCGQRINRIISAVQRHKLVSIDVLEGKGLQDLARNPDEHLSRKIKNLRSNALSNKTHKPRRKRVPQALHESRQGSFAPSDQYGKMERTRTPGASLATNKLEHRNSDVERSTMQENVPENVPHVSIGKRKASEMEDEETEQRSDLRSVRPRQDLPGVSEQGVPLEIYDEPFNMPSHFDEAFFGDAQGEYRDDF
ncbi:uncharacterized protein RCC_09903 [Ramularia collo-cygni]|uniref:Uncharacterized protein n=1 Tax=Ramularia collo-cygni TaxID=112498 RepID=A0A2D3V477_9PEZI|nr:uncharacterized protein RCC_09903 [Ramularia collo-cygni]CZT24186.1 uncharacterized protein RCC_09903 [Ramularia collo-cygni]